MPTSHPMAWKHLRSENGPHLRIFQVRYDWMENPRNAEILQTVILECRDWVNIVALTPENRLIMVEQYRFGAGKVTLEVPAGVMEPDETPKQAAQRELQEETGYTTNDWTYLGWVDPNPAFMNNRCHHWVARNVVKTHQTALDAGEAILVRDVSLADVQQAIRNGTCRSSLGLIALSQIFDIWKDGAQPVFSDAC
jgi:ADP-ribose pyrophosphatase